MDIKVKFKNLFNAVQVEKFNLNFILTINTRFYKQFNTKGNRVILLFPLSGMTAGQMPCLAKKSWLVHQYQMYSLF